MATFGIKLAVLEITPQRQPDNSFELDDAVFGPGGALARIDEALTAARRRGDDDQRASTYSEIVSTAQQGCGVQVVARHGAYGTRRETVDRRNGSNGPTLSKDEAVLQESRLVFIVPDTGTRAVVVSEVRGRSHATKSVIKQLAHGLRPLGVVPRLRSEVADGIAWSKFLESEDSGIVGVELTNKTRYEDGVRLVDGDGVETVDLRLTIDPDSGTATGVLHALRDRYLAKKSNHERINLARVVGVTGYRESDDEDRRFDDERVIVVENGRQRTINISRELPSFVYPINTDDVPTDEEFQEEARPIVAELFEDLEIELPQGWWPAY